MNRKLLLIIFYLFTFCISTFGQTIIINEIMSSNEYALTDADGDHEDWIELYNYGSQSIDLFGLSISDDENNWEKWQFPHVIMPANSYTIVFASGKDKQLAGEVHTNFKIKQAGEALYLSHSGQLISSTPAVFIPTDGTYGVEKGSQTQYTFFAKSTPRRVNVIMNDLTASHSSGFYKEAFNLVLSGVDSTQKIFYTLDGSIPTPSSLEYVAPILVKNNSNAPNKFSDIPTTPLSGFDLLYQYIWRRPSTVYKSNVVRFASYDGQNRTSDVYGYSYFVDKAMETRYSYPVVSIITDSLNLFGHETGIYIPGQKFEDFGFFGYHPHGNYHNRGRSWERPVHVSYFENDGTAVFETNAGMRMRGLGALTYAQKSFMLYFRKEYGLDKIEAPIFKNSEITGYKRLVFRSSGNDFKDTHFKDALLQSALRSLDLELQNFEPVIVFINGEYWGIHNMREKYDQHYINNHYGIDKDEVNMLEWCGLIETGSDADYLTLMDYVYNNDLSEETHYEYIKRQVDIENYIDFQIAEIYYANEDWPCNNYKMWKTNEEHSKWRFLIHDLDQSFGYAQNSTFDTPSMEHATKLDSVWPHCECSNIMFVRLLENETFKQLFISRFEEYLSTIFDVERMLGMINEFTNLFGDEMQEHIERWSYPDSFSQWNDKIEVLRTFAINRPCYMKENLINFFNLSGLNYECQDPDDFISTPNLVIAPNPSTGYFYLKNNSSSILNGNLIIRNIYGQIVYQDNNLILYNYQKEYLNLEYLPSGAYFVMLDDDEKVEMQKMVIVR